ncbi:MAG: T9SS type A sorting domain-containing protein, partial [Flavisolibacter sp.]
KYRVVVGTTSGSLSNTNCQVTDGVSQISLSVVDCSTPLGTNIISFNANATNKHANLFWTTNRETDQVQFEIERSVDGINFSRIGRVRGLHSTDDINRYSFTDTLLPVRSYYRISLADLAGRKIYSRIMQLQTTGEFTVSNVTNYFETGISLDVNVSRNSKVALTLLNGSGNVVKTMMVNAYAGTNNYIIPSLTTLPRGVYILQVRNEEKTVTVKAIKK